MATLMAVGKVAQGGDTVIEAGSATLRNGRITRWDDDADAAFWAGADAYFAEMAAAAAGGEAVNWDNVVQVIDDAAQRLRK